MKKALIKFIPFWESDVIGTLSKISLTFTTTIMGLFSGTICLICGIMIIKLFTYSKADFTIGYAFRGLLYLVIGSAYIFHYIFTRKGFYLKNSKLLTKSYVMFAIAYFSYRFINFEINITKLIYTIIIIMTLGIPLNKAKEAFIAQEKSLKKDYSSN